MKYTGGQQNLGCECTFAFKVYPVYTLALARKIGRQTIFLTHISGKNLLFQILFVLLQAI